MSWSLTMQYLLTTKEYTMDYIDHLRAEIAAIFALELLTPCDIRRLGSLEMQINNAMNQLDNNY